ncbi:MAG TPA: dihydroorotate dehydrogenase-like protein [Bacteroidales bacterium]|nr:dihydroorotate dehydrogenase-like protein [Bacteroidales bacterium]
MDLTTRYLGFTLKNPIIVASSGLTSTVEGVAGCEKNGAAAVALKSLFEEQILFNYQEKLKEVRLDATYPEAEEYISRHTKEKAVDEYLTLIRDCKKAVGIPVFASINCISASEWTNFAREIELAGADGLELNLSILPSDTVRTSAQIEDTYIEILNEVVRKTSLPVTIKISSHFSSVAKTALRFSFTGVKGMVLFNRFFTPDIDIEEFRIVPGRLFSTPADITPTVRWISILSERVFCDIAASTGIHEGEGLVKALLAGAKAAEICSVLYEKGLGEIAVLLKFLEDFLTRHHFSSVSEIIGKMSMRQTENPAALERVQFMKQFSGIE